MCGNDQDIKIKEWLDPTHLPHLNELDTTHTMLSKNKNIYEIIITGLPALLAMNAAAEMSDLLKHHFVAKGIVNHN